MCGGGRGDETGGRKGPEDLRGGDGHRHTLGVRADALEIEHGAGVVVCVINNVIAKHMHGDICVYKIVCRVPKIPQRTVCGKLAED